MKGREQEVESSTFTELLCLYPCRSVPSGTIEEVYSYLRGCEILITYFNLELKSPSPIDALGWFGREFDTLGGGLQFDALRQKYGSDEKVLEAMFHALPRTPSDCL